MPASTGQVEMSGAAFVTVCVKVHDSGPPVGWGPHSIGNCQNSSLADLPKGAGFGPAPFTSEPFAWNILVEDHHRERQEEADPTEQRHRDKCLNVGDRRRRRARKNPCNCSDHVTLQNFWGGLRLMLCRWSTSTVHLLPSVNI